jgi:hypothetical protein
MASIRSRVKKAVSEQPLLHDVLQSGYQLGRFLFAQLPLTLYCKWCTYVSKRSGVTESGRAVPIIVSLTSYGPRLRSATVCIETLLQQSVRPDRLILWLAHDEDTATVAGSLRRFERRGLEVRRCEDLRSFKKIIPTIREFPEAIIVTADDDVFYPGKWLERLLNAYETDRNVIHCHLSQIIKFDLDGSPLVKWPSGNDIAGTTSFLVFPIGVGGVLYPPGSLDDRVIDYELSVTLCSQADDIWLKAMSLLANTPCRQTRDFPEHYLQVPGSQVVSLWRSNVEDGGNDEQLFRTFTYFGLWDQLREWFRIQEE